MVTKHLEKLQQEKEKNSFAMIQALHADVGPTICALSLEETSWDVDAASTTLKRFKAENEDKLRKLMKVCQLVFLLSPNFVSFSRFRKHTTVCLFAVYSQSLFRTYICVLQLPETSKLCLQRRQESTIAQTRPGGKAATANVALDSDNRAFRKHRRQETTTDSHSKKHKSSKHQKEAAPQVKELHFHQTCRHMAHWPSPACSCLAWHLQLSSLLHSTTTICIWRHVTKSLGLCVSA